MITLAYVRTVTRAFENSTTPKLSDAWHAERHIAVSAVQEYAAQEGLTTDQVIAQVKGNAS